MLIIDFAKFYVNKIEVFHADIVVNRYKKYILIFTKYFDDNKNNIISLHIISKHLI